MRLRSIAITTSTALMTFGMALPASAASKTCTQRHQVCLDYCGKNHSKSGKCTSTCSDSLAQCKADGCWTSPLVAKQCGFAKQ